jgi:predicted phage terminase large subunit-like protein
VRLSFHEYEYIIRRDFMSFIERSFYELNPQTPFVSGPHIELIATKLEACRQGAIKRLIINLPPRGLKSHCATIAFPAWVLGHNPNARIICASYGQDLSDKFGRDCRTVMTSGWYQQLFPTRVANRQAVARLMTTQQGERTSTSVGGVLTGLGADLIIVDDPLKPDEALSELGRKAVNDWYNNTLLSRLNDKASGCIIIIMQRLHQDDLVGHVLDREPWEVLSLPAIAERDETHTIVSPFGTRLFTRKVGDVLHPERESATVYANIRQTIGEYNFLSQYQQNPSPPGGALVKTDWLKSYEPGEQPASFGRTVISLDSANKATELSDYSVFTIWGVDYRHYYLLDVVRSKLNYPDLKRKVIELADKYRGATILIEDKASGTQLIQELQSSSIIGVTAYKPPPGADKIMRLHAQTAMFENGRVFLPRSAPWLADYIHELTSFPGSRYADQVDSTTQFLDYIGGNSDLETWIKLGRMSPLGFDFI